MRYATTALLILVTLTFAQPASALIGAKVKTVVTAAKPAAAAMTPGQPLSFDQAVTRALQANPDPTNALSKITLPPGHSSPTIRAEAGLNSAKDVNVFTKDLVSFDTITALLSVDYPLIDGGAAGRRRTALESDLALLRLRSHSDAERTYIETLETFARLYSAQRRIEIMGDAAQRGAKLRQRATRLLDVRQITNVTAAQWQDQAYSAQAQLLDLQLQRNEAESHLKQLIGDTSTEPLRLKIDLSDAADASSRNLRVDSLVGSDTAVMQSRLEEERRRLQLLEVQALRKPQLGATAYAGVASLPGHIVSDNNSSEGNFGVYGLRFSLALPMFDPSMKARVTSASIELEQAHSSRRSTESAARDRLQSLWLTYTSLEQRVSLLTDALRIARERQQSIARLTSAGVTTEEELFSTFWDLARREADLVAARVERWKIQQSFSRLKADDQKALAIITELGRPGRNEVRR